MDDTSKGEGDRRYSLPEAHAEALNDLDSPLSITPLARQVVSAAQTLPLLLKTYRTGEGVPWEAYGADMIESQGDFHRPWPAAASATPTMSVMIRLKRALLRYHILPVI